MTDTIENIDQYYTIFVGYPIWWSLEPRIIDTFLESYDFSDKTVIPFCTFHSSGMSTSERNIKNLGVAYGELLNGRRFSADSTKDDVSDWLDILNIRKEREVGVLDFETKTVILNSSYEMPILRLGTYSLLDDTCVNSVVAELLGDETINSIAEVHNVSAEQIILRWNLQRNVVVIPGSSNPDHIKENFDIFGFELSDDEMEQIKVLNRDEKHDWY